MQGGRNVSKSDFEKMYGNHINSKTLSYLLNNPRLVKDLVCQVIHWQGHCRLSFIEFAIVLLSEIWFPPISKQLILVDFGLLPTSWLMVFQVPFIFPFSLAIFSVKYCFFSSLLRVLAWFLRVLYAVI